MKTATLVIGALLIGGGFYLYSQHEAAAKTAPSLESKANLALASESNPYTLEALAQQCDANGLHELAGLLHAKSQTILAFQKTKVQSAPLTPPSNPAASVALLGAGVSQGSAALSFHQALLAGGIHAPKFPDGGYGPQPDPNLSPQNL